MRPSLQQIPSTPHASWAYRLRREPAFPFDWHYHPEHELTLIVSGTGRRYVGDAVRDYVAGDLVLVGGGTPHTWESTGDGPHEAVVLQFHRDAFGATLFELPEFRDVGRLLDASAAGLAFAGPAASGIADRVAALADAPPTRRTLGLLDALVALSELAHETLASRTLVGAIRPAARERVAQVIAYVNRQHAGPVGVAEAAQLVAMTPNAFSRFFQRSTGLTFGAFVNDVRLARACERLIEQDTPVSQIAADCGFGNLSNFNRRFRAKTGMSPREYRRHFHATAG